MEEAYTVHLLKEKLDGITGTTARTGCCSSHVRAQMGLGDLSMPWGQA